MLNDDYNLAKKIESSKQKVSRNYFAELVLLTRLWRTEEKHMSFIKDNLEKRLKIVFPELNENFIEEKINDIIMVARKKGALSNNIIHFSKEELEFIKSLNDDRFENFIFIMFCIYKSNLNKSFNISQNKLMGYTKEKSKSVYSEDLFSKFLNKSEELNIFYCRIYNNGIEYCASEFAKNIFNKDNIILSIDNKENIVYYYMMHKNPNNYYFCKKCGNIEQRIEKKKTYYKDDGRVRSGVKAKYCRKCSTFLQ